MSAFARHWRQEQLEAKLQAAKQSYVPLQFVPGKAFQFDWSEDWVKINGVSTKLQIAHFKLCYSRAYFMWAYLAQSHEMLFEFRGQFTQFHFGSRLNLSGKTAGNTIMASMFRFLHSQYTRRINYR